MEILVYGAGAIGGYLGGQLALAGHRVTLVARPDTVQCIAAYGLIISQDDLARTADVRAVDSLSAAFQEPACDLIILGMKAYDLEEAVAELAHAGARPAHLLCTQNGIGVEEIVARHFGPERVLAGTVTIPISRGAPNELVVERAGRGLGIAPVQPGRPVDEWVALFADAGIRAAALPDYRAMKWSKAFLNIMGNASAAILNRPPAELYRQGQLFDLEMRMLRETLAVMDALGLRVANLPGAAVRPLAASLNLAPRFLLKPVFTQVIVHGRGDKMPSFHMDLARQKGRSEVVFHNGAIAAAGKRIGLAAPVNAAFSDILSAMAAGEIAREMYDNRPDRLVAAVKRYERNEENQ